MRELDRRELLRAGAWLVAGTAVAGLPARGSSVVDVTGGRRLLAKLLRGEAVSAVARARHLGGSRSKSGGRAIFTLGGRTRIVVDLTASSYRFNVWSRRLGGVTLGLGEGAPTRLVARPSRAARAVDPYDTAIEFAGGVVLTTSATAGQRSIPPRRVVGARLPPVYRELGRALLERMERSPEVFGRRARRGGRNSI